MIELPDSYDEWKLREPPDENEDVGANEQEWDEESGWNDEEDQLEEDEDG